jgi:hypothetical protein
MQNPVIPTPPGLTSCRAASQSRKVRVSLMMFAGDARSRNFSRTLRASGLEKMRCGSIGS